MVQNSLKEYNDKLCEIQRNMNILRNELTQLEQSGKQSIASIDSVFFEASNKVLNMINHLEKNLLILNEGINNMSLKLKGFNEKKNREFLNGRRGSIMDNITRSLRALRKLRGRYKSVAKNTDKISFRSIQHQSYSNAQDVGSGNYNGMLEMDVLLNLTMMIVLAYKSIKK